MTSKRNRNNRTIIPNTVTETKVEEPKVETKVEEPKVEEPKVEDPKVETKVEEPKVEEPKNTTGLADSKAVAKYLTSPGVSIQAKLDEIAVNGPGSIKALVCKLLDYEKSVGVNAVISTPALFAGKNYDLYNTLKAAIDTVDAQEFTTKMDIINLVFKQFSGAGNAYNEFLLHRFDTEWKWGAKALSTYQALATVICTLCDLSTRAKKLGTVSLEKALAPGEVTLSPTSIDRVKGYYGK